MNKNWLKISLCSVYLSLYSTTAHCEDPNPRAKDFCSCALVGPEAQLYLNSVNIEDSEKANSEASLQHGIPVYNQQLRTPSIDTLFPMRKVEERRQAALDDLFNHHLPENYIYAGLPRNGLIAIRDKGWKHCGVMDVNGKIVVPVAYFHVDICGANFIAVKKQLSVTDKVLHRNGQQLLHGVFACVIAGKKYSMVEPYADTLHWALWDNEAGKIVLRCHNGPAAQYKNNQETLWSQFPGALTVPAIYNLNRGHIFLHVDNGLAKACADNGLYGIVGLNGSWVVKARFLDLDYPPQCKSTWFRCYPQKHIEYDSPQDLYFNHSINDVSGITDLLASSDDIDEYRHKTNFNEGARGPCNYVNLSNKLISQNDFEEGQEFSEGFAAVKQNGKFGFIDETGVKVIPFVYERALSFREGLAAVMLKGKWGYIDKSGKIVAAPSFLRASSFRHGVAVVECEDNVDGKIEKRRGGLSRKWLVKDDAK